MSSGLLGAQELREELVAARLTGAVATSPASTLLNAALLISGDERYTFGLPDWEEASVEDAVAAVAEVCGADPSAAAPDGLGMILPERTLAAIALHRDRLAAVATRRGRVLLATGHPTGLIPHYAAIGRALVAAGCSLLTPLEEYTVIAGDAPRRIRYLDSVACVTDGGRLLHTHRSRFMETMLDHVGPGNVDLVVADHGMAGAAIARGIATLSIADVNDPALPLAQVRGRTDAVLPIDDNLAPRLFAPVTRAVLSWT